MVTNGGISRRKKEGEAQYALMPLLLWGMYEHQLRRLSPSFLQDVGQYMTGEFGLELATSRLPKMRVIPVEESVEAELAVSTYDELRRLIEQAGEHIPAAIIRPHQMIKRRRIIPQYLTIFIFGNVPNGIIWCI